MNGGMSQQKLMERELLARPVASLQYMLHRLSQGDPNLPALVVDGVFGARTLESVMLLQRSAGLPVTGVVDRATWDMICQKWRALEEEFKSARSTRIFPSEGTRVEEGSTREYMILPQAMFQILGRYFLGIETDRPDGVHGRASANNVRWLQNLAKLPVTGIMNRATWDMLSRLYEIFVVKELENQPDYTGGWG